MCIRVASPAPRPTRTVSRASSAGEKVPILAWMASPQAEARCTASPSESLKAAGQSEMSASPAIFTTSPPCEWISSIIIAK